MFHSAPERFTTRPEEPPPFCTIRLPVLVSFTVPAFVKTFSKYTVLLALMLKTALVAMVKALPIKIPPVQLNWLLMTTGDDKLAVPLVTLTMSFAAGTPLGDQLVGLYQSWLMVPIHVRLIWAEVVSRPKTDAKASPQQKYRIFFAAK